MAKSHLLDTRWTPGVWFWGEPKHNAKAAQTDAESDARVLSWLTFVDESHLADDQRLGIQWEISMGFLRGS